jgi:hypothetical protein
MTTCAEVPGGVLGAKGGRRPARCHFHDSQARSERKGNGKGLNLDVPILPLTGPVTAQLVVDLGMSGERCWSATFPTAQKAGPKVWQAKLD